MKPLGVSSLGWATLALAAMALAPLAHAADEDNSGVYTLDSCPVSGAKLSSMGDAVVKVYEGREFRFCCEGCPKKFEADPKQYIEKVDAAVIKEQKPLYPVETCLVSGQKLGSMGDPIEYIYGNRLVRFCCKGCIEKFKKDAPTYLAKLDEEAAKKQMATYPVDVCVVSGDKLGEDAKDMVIAGRLVRLCCGSCPKAVKKNPQKYLSMLDEAAKSKKMAKPQGS